MTDHALAAQIIARDTALSHALDDQIASVAEQIASLDRAAVVVKEQRSQRFAKLVDYLNSVYAAEDEAAHLEGAAVAATLQAEADRLAKLRDQVRSGEALMPVAAQLSAPNVDPERVVEEAATPVQGGLGEVTGGAL